MENRNVWLACGEAMDATVEGERMIAHRMADGIADAWHRLLPRHRSCPPRCDLRFRGSLIGFRTS